VKTADLDIVPGADPDKVEKSDEVVTQIIPIRYANATQLMNNLQVLLPTTATLSANESANTLILVATKTDIKRMLKIVHALDSSIANVSSIRVFPLQYADARQLATVVQQLFAPQGGQGQGNARAQIMAMMGGGRGGFPGGGPGGGGGGNAGGGPGSGANAAGTKVVAAADEYSNSLIVGAAPEVMTAVAEMVQQIDLPVSDVTELRVFRLLNADPSEVADQLAQLFPDDSRNSGNNGGGRFQFFGAGGGGGRGQTSTSDRSRKKNRVLAVPDPRTASLIVSAGSDLMPQIAEMIAQLDSNPAKREQVAVYELQNANPQDVQQVLQDLFNRNSTMRNNNANTRGSLLGQNNPLNQRSTQQQQSTANQNSRFGTQSRQGTGF
jgi:general secretion pathway protein D